MVVTCSVHGCLAKSGKDCSESFHRFPADPGVRQKWLDLFDLIAEGKTKQRPPNFEVPDRELPCRLNVQPGTWFARDNVFNFILFCRKLGNFLYYTLCTYILCSKI